MAILAAAALISGAVIFGSDLFALLVLRPSLQLIDDTLLWQLMGRVHQFGDRRLPPFFLISLASGLIGTLTSLASGSPQAIGFAVAVTAYAGWFVVFLVVAAPVNRRMRRAVADGPGLSDARQLQRRWDAALPARAALQGAAMVALLSVLVFG